MGGLGGFSVRRSTTVRGGNGRKIDFGGIMGRVLCQSLIRIKQITRLYWLTVEVKVLLA
jgi:hypothetical protein